MRFAPILFTALIALASAAAADPAQWRREWPNTDFSITSLETWDEVISGGPPRDGIPALSDPAFISVAEESRLAGFMNRATHERGMSAPPEEFYSEERWQNWLDRIRDEDIDPEDEDSARLLLNLQDDVAIAVAKIVTAYDDSDIDEEEALDELADIRETVLGEVAFDDEEKAMLIDGVQTSLVCVFYSAEEYVAGGPADEAAVEEYVVEASKAEEAEDLDSALGLVAAAGTRIIDGEELDIAVTEDIEYGLVTEWVNGLDSLQSAMSDPEVVEEEDED